jgi:hypothetical protein
MATDQEREHLIVVGDTRVDMPDHPGIAVDVLKPVPIQMAMVSVKDLRALQSSNDDEQQSSGFCLACGGAALSAILAAMASEPVESMKDTYWSITTILGIASLWFGFTWYRKRRAKGDVLRDLIGSSKTRYFARSHNPAEKR